MSESTDVRSTITYAPTYIPAMIYSLFVDVVIKPEVSKSISVANEWSTENADGGTSGFR